MLADETANDFRDLAKDIVLVAGIMIKDEDNDLQLKLAMELAKDEVCEKFRLLA